MGPKPRPPLERFMEKVGAPDERGCWPWLAATLNGYGLFNFGRQSIQSHRAAYRLFVGEIPARHHVHHRCENPSCVNPEHLELLTAGAHSSLHHRRPVGATCKNGHPWVEENLYVYVNNRGETARCCATCKRELSRQHYYARKEAAVA